MIPTQDQWSKFSLMEQLGNVGSDVERAISWRKKGNETYSQAAFERAIDQLDLTIRDPRWSIQRREICRVKEVLCDYFIGQNRYQSTEETTQKYFYWCALAANAMKEYARKAVLN